MNQINERASIKNLDHSSDPNGFRFVVKNDKSSPYYGYFVVLFAFIIMVIQWGIFHSFGVYFKPMISEFGWTRALTSGAFSLAGILSGLVSVYVGWLNDRFGSRVVMSFCGLFLGLGCILMSQTESLWNFYI